MARGGEIAPKHKNRNKVQLKEKGSDESDEDYTVGEDEEFDESEDEYFSSLADDETEESLEEFEEEEEFEECVKKSIIKVGRPRGRKSSQGKNEAVKSRKKNAAYSEEGGEDCDYDDFAGAKGRKKSMPPHERKGDNDDIGALCRQEQEDFGEEKPRKKTWVSSIKKNVDHCNKKSRKKNKVSYREENEDSGCDDSDEDEDEEFTVDEVDGVDDDDDDELPAMKKNKVGRSKRQEAQITKGRKRKRNFKALKRTKRKKLIKKQVVRRRNRYHHKEFRDKGPIAQKAKRSTENGRGRRKLDASSGSDFVTSGLSDYEFTISEEEREQIREANEFCGRITTSLRSSSSLKLIKEEETVPLQRKHPRRKDKEKMVEMKVEVGKEVCGVCLSEEGKKTVRGILNCCSHFFCFACIMEWSKVESRCPLCKQRFATISKVDGGHDSRDVVIPVPERDQVYQPSEEELRGYLDPYESVLCTECHQGGDEALMLLCDLCDSPAHTYCVGLGHAVPEGNWYCDGCRPSVLAPSIAQSLNPTPSRGANNNSSVGSSPFGAVRETFDLNELYIPETPSSQVTGHSASPRYSVFDSQAASPSSGLGAFTLYERRRIQRQIHLLLNYRSRQSERSYDVAPATGTSLFGSQISHLQPVPVQVAPQNINHQGRLPDCTTPSSYGREALQPRSIGLRGQVLHHQASTSTNHSLSELSHTESSQTTARIGHGLGQQQLHPCDSISNTGANASISPSQFGDVSHVSPQKEHVQSTVRSHLKSLSRNLGLDVVTFKCIARTSTHTILAAFGLEHRWNEVHPVQTRPLICDHLDGVASQQTCPVAGQCSSCFDWFIGNVVTEIISSRFPLLSKD